MSDKNILDNIAVDNKIFTIRTQFQQVRVVVLE